MVNDRMKLLSLVFTECCFICNCKCCFYLFRRFRMCRYARCCCCCCCSVMLMLFFLVDT